MVEKLKKHHRWLLSVVIIICLAVILVGGIRYVEKLRDNLEKNTIQSLMTVTIQQQQALDTLLTEEREQLHKFAEYLALNADSNPEEVKRLLTIYEESDSIHLVICLDDGWVCGTSFSDIRQLDAEQLDTYRSLEGSGVRDSYIGLYSGTPRFCYYETFTFRNGHKGLVQKSYDRSTVSKTFSLSFYNNLGSAYIVNTSGDILIRSTDRVGDGFYENIFDILTDTHAQQESIDTFKSALDAQQVGSITFAGDTGKYIYTYVTIENVEDWYLVSVVPVDTIEAETSDILQDSQVAVALLLLLLLVCAVFVVLIWRTQRELTEKNREIAYQAQLFDFFISYLANNSNDVYMMLDQETEKLEYVSPNVEQVLGVSKDGLFAYMEASDMAANPEATKAYYAALNAAVPSQPALSRSIERINPKTGEHKFFLENAYCIEIQGRIKRVCYVSDRTKERQIQESLSEALRMAKAANEAKSAFLSNMSHDIRTPMNAIIGFLALMRDEADNPAMVREYTQRIDAASQHLLSLINDILDMNKIESGSATLNLTDLSLSEVITEINTIIRPQAKAKGQAFNIYVSHMEHEHLQGDKLRINQILINLLSNSVKYTPNGGTLDMRVEELPQVMPDYSRIRFTIKDNGLGMSEDYLKVIFDPFTREETNATQKIQGTGLGMAITKSLVDLMGGSIRVESTLDQGSAFTVELELRIQQREEEDPGFWGEHKVNRMIVTDDDELVCQNIVKTMAKTGVSTDYATDGETALRMMREAREAGKPYDLILLDWMMPNLDGLQTARLIRKEYSDNIPILLLTAYDWSDIEQEAIEIGISHFMPKPFFMSTFKDAIRRVMGSQKKAADNSGQTDVVRGKHVLVVDDIEVNRIILVKILTTLGAVCDTAGNGQEAVEKFQRSQPGEFDLILMDVQMPVMDGYTATRTIRNSKHRSARKVPIIAMTANAFVDDVRDAIESGMDAHIAKPVQIDKLKATIQQVLDARQGQ